MVRHTSKCTYGDFDHIWACPGNSDNIHLKRERLNFPLLDGYLWMIHPLVQEMLLIKDFEIEKQTWGLGGKLLYHRTFILVDSRQKKLCWSFPKTLINTFFGPFSVVSPKKMGKMFFLQFSSSNAQLVTCKPYCYYYPFLVRGTYSARRESFW